VQEWSIIEGGDHRNGIELVQRCVEALGARSSVDFTKAPPSFRVVVELEEHMRASGEKESGESSAPSGEKYSTQGDPNNPNAIGASRKSGETRPLDVLLEDGASIQPSGVGDSRVQFTLGKSHSVVLDSASISAETTASPEPKGVTTVATTRVYILEDSELIQHLLLLVLRRVPGMAQVVMRGLTDEEISTFSAEVISASPDLVILDQILVSPSKTRKTVLGTDVAAELRKGGFKGLVIMSSANDSLPPGEYSLMPKGLSAKRKVRYLDQLLSARPVRTGTKGVASLKPRQPGKGLSVAGTTSPKYITWC
jgi:hypothetical protein